ncbi:MAG: restriction endonuclease, partial [Bacillus cereus]|nr:restriction endonuclease [Bacillus cereus]
DGLIKDNNKEGMIEAKDYTIDKRKVGRGDIQKLQGALSDLPINEGIYASATEYTKPARDYANSSKNNPLQKDIDLYNIRPSTVEDEEGRIKKIIINFSIHSLDYQNGVYQPIWSKKGYNSLEQDGYIGKQIELRLENFYNKEGKIVTSLFELTHDNPPTTTWDEDFTSEGCWVIKDGYLNINGSLYSIKGIQYKVPVSTAKQEMVIEGGGTPKIYIKSENGEINKLITDKDLKKIIFNDGKVELID